MKTQDRRRINFYHARKVAREHSRRLYELSAYSDAVRNAWGLPQVRACVSGELPIPEGCTMAQVIEREAELTALFDLEISARKNGAGNGRSLAQVHAAELVKS